MSRAASFLSPLLKEGDTPFVLRNVRTGSVLATQIEKAFDSKNRRRGLLGRDSFAHGSALIIAPCNGVHMFFMRFTIDVIFSTREGVVLKVCAGLKPWRIAFAASAFAAIEFPQGTLQGPRQCVPGDRLELCPPAGLSPIGDSAKWL